MSITRQNAKSFARQIAAHHALVLEVIIDPVIDVEDADESDGVLDNTEDDEERNISTLNKPNQFLLLETCDGSPFITSGDDSVALLLLRDFCGQSYLCILVCR